MCEDYALNKTLFLSSEALIDHSMHDYWEGK